MAQDFVKMNFMLTGDDMAKLMWLMEKTGHISKSTYIRYLVRQEYERMTAELGGERAKTNEPSIPAV